MTAHWAHWASRKGGAYTGAGSGVGRERTRARMSDIWASLDALVAASEVVIDRPRGTAHPRYPDITYPFDYGYLAGTRSSDGAGIDVWIGSLTARTITGLVVTVDLHKRESEIKLLLGCTAEEAEAIAALHSRGSQSSMLVRRPS